MSMKLARKTYTINEAETQVISDVEVGSFHDDSSNFDR